MDAQNASPVAMNGMVFCMVFVWFGHGLGMVSVWFCVWCVYGWCMVLMWFWYGVGMVLVKFAYGFGVVWYGLCMVLVSCGHGLGIGFVWFWYSASMV